MTNGAEADSVRVFENELDYAHDWAAYKSSPSGAALGRLISTVPVETRTALIDALERLCHEQANWKIAQHLCLLHQDRFNPRSGEVDLIRALYFADLAKRAKPNEPAVLLAVANLNWERRIPLAVLHDATNARVLLAASPSDDRTATILGGECSRLLGLAHAYLGDPEKALHEMRGAERAGSLTGPDLVHLLFGARARSQEASHWASVRLAPYLHALGSRPAAVVTVAIRAALIRVLRMRTTGEIHDGSRL